MMRAYIAVRRENFHDGPYAIAVTNIATRQSTIPPLAFPTIQAAEKVVDAIVAAAPNLYTNVYPWKDAA
jgi:hypothetical protein